MVWQHHTTVHKQQLAAEFTAAARQGVTALMSIDANHAKDDFQRIIDDSTGDFKSQMSAMSALMAKQTEESKVSSKATVEAVAVESMSDNSAVVLVAARSDATAETHIGHLPCGGSASASPGRRSAQNVESRFPAMTVEHGSSLDGAKQQRRREDSAADETGRHPLALDRPAQRAGRVKRWTRRYLARWRSIVATALVVAAVGVAAGVFFVLYRPDQQVGDAAAHRAIQAASDGAVSVLSYSTTIWTVISPRRSHISPVSFSPTTANSPNRSSRRRRSRGT